MKMYVKIKKKPNVEKSKINFIKIRTIQRVFIVYMNYLSITFPSKETFVSKSEP